MHTQSFSETPLRERLQWFLRNLEFLIEDIQFEDAGKQPRVFFDTYDVSDSLLSLESYRTEDGPGFQLYPRFATGGALVQALFSDGWLGAVEMLPPHQAEFLHGMHVDFGVSSNPQSFKKKIDQFLAALSLEDLSDEMGVRDLSKMAGADLLDYVRRRARGAADVFKVLHAIKEQWKPRLTRWREHRLLMVRRLVAGQLEYSTLVQRDSFRNVLAAFEARRPGAGPSNFSDAMAMQMLELLVDQFRRGHTPEIPRFFVSSDAWKEIIEETNIGRTFSYETEGASLSTPFRDADYFIFKALYRPAPEKRRLLDDARPLFSGVSAIRDVSEKLQAILKAQTPLTPEIVQSVRVEGRGLDKVIDEIRCFSFFENVWLPVLGEGEAKEVVSSLGDAARHLASPQFRRQVERAVKETKRAFAQSVERYEQVADLWKKVSSAGVKLREVLDAASVDDRLLQLDGGLVRFGLSEKALGIILEVIRQLVSGSKEELRIAVARVVQAAGWKGEKKSRPNSEGELCSGVLWVLKLDRENIKTLERSSQRSRSLILLESAVRLRSGLDSSRAEHLVEALEKKYEAEKEPRERAHLASGLAYLLYRLWLRSGGMAWWRQDAAGGTSRRSQELRSLERKTMEYAMAARDRSVGELKRIYAANQFLFYAVEMDLAEYESELDAALHELLKARDQDPLLWSFRYDDSLARYYHRLAQSDASKHAQWMGLARFYSRAAVKSSRGESRVSEYSAALGVSE